MFEINGVAWTTESETLEMRRVFLEKHGGTEEQPICSFCKRLTEYVMEHWESGRGFLKPGANLVFAMMKFPVLVNEATGVAYLPSTNCWKCAAAYDGKSGRVEPDWSRRALLPEQAHESRAIYWRERNKMFAAKAAQSAKKSARYS